MSAARWAAAAVWRAAVLYGLWWVLAGGDEYFWAYGLVAAAAATALSLAMAPPRAGDDVRGRPLRFARRAWLLAGFALWFAGAMLRGGIDVARRSLAPSLPIDPHEVEVDVRTPAGPGRRAVLWLVNLLPGSIVTGVSGDRARLHLIARDTGAKSSWDELDSRMKRVVGE